MPYRPTERTEARKPTTRERIVAAARELIASGGYAEAQVAAVAARARVATGTVYRHFPSKADLFAEVFREASQHEVDAFSRRGEAAPAARRRRIAAAVEAFARRALRAPRLAWALLAEPVDPAIEAERLVFRRAYRDAIAGVIADGVDAGELPPQDAGGQRGRARRRDRRGDGRPALPHRGDPTTPRPSIASLRDFCIRSVTGKEPPLSTLEERPRDHDPRGLEPVAPARRLQRLRRRDRALSRRSSARAAAGRRTGPASSARSAAGADVIELGRLRRTRTRRGFAPTTASATGSTRSSSTPRGTS